MSYEERMLLIPAIWETGVDEELGLTLESVHDLQPSNDQTQGNWRVVLSSKSGRIYFIHRIIALVDTLDIDIAIYTDVHYPGCIILN